MEHGTLSLPIVAVAEHVSINLGYCILQNGTSIQDIHTHGQENQLSDRD
jgi:hypothetical protein